MNEGIIIFLSVLNFFVYIGAFVVSVRFIKQKVSEIVSGYDTSIEKSFSKHKIAILDQEKEKYFIESKRRTILEIKNILEKHFNSLEDLEQEHCKYYYGITRQLLYEEHKKINLVNNSDKVNTK